MKRTLEPRAYIEDFEALAKFAKGFGHTKHIAILKHLENQSYCFTDDWVDALSLAQSMVSQHLKKIKNVGLIQRELEPHKEKYCIYQDNRNIEKTVFQQFFD